MSTAEAAPAPGLPDYLASPNAVLGDTEAQWRYGRAPDYSKTRKVWAETKRANHTAGSLPELVENLVKNWEVEASFKTKLSDWRTVDHENYTFAINGGPPQTGEHMLRVGTYNAIIAPNEYYSPENSDFASSHKTFKRMMPTFAWEVIEVYSGPPTVSFKWRHWGTMKNDYVGFNDKGEKVTAKAHGGIIDILGITIATVDEKVRLQAVDTYFDPLDMFRQIAPKGVVNKQVVNQKVFDADKAAALNDSMPSHDGVKIGKEFNKEAPSHTTDNGTTAASTEHESTSSRGTTSRKEDTKDSSAEELSDKLTNTGLSQGQSQSPANGEEHAPTRSKDEAKIHSSPYSSSVTGNVGDRPKIDYSAEAGVYDHIDEGLERDASEVHPHPKTMEEAVKPEAGEAVVAEPGTRETIMTHEEMSRITGAECPFLMNRE